MLATAREAAPLPTSGGRAPSILRGPQVLGDPAVNNHIKPEASGLQMWLFRRAGGHGCDMLRMSAVEGATNELSGMAKTLLRRLVDRRRAGTPWLRNQPAAQEARAASIQVEFEADLLRRSRNAASERPRFEHRQF